ncbi:GNAT family N-acetyltransferase [Filimonas effusa]|uniref:N-acetyltransferase n=1 Tax=Filimonas effusa TaxID=2508721 RepID=A0A4Q1D361_9BACT|nr:GNAT family protein [Filimonas effusa]RXK82795.1 N-acetyltransferase [Filimonas effusa]
MQSFPQLETERLLLNELQETDLQNLVQYANNKKVSEYTLNLPYPYKEEDALYWLDTVRKGFEHKSQFFFAIRLKEDGEFIGGIGLVPDQRHKRAEIGYWLAEPFWNRNILTEAAMAVIDFGFNAMELNKITAHYLEGNPASGRVMQKCSMEKEGELKEHIYKDERFYDIEIYGLTRSSYLSL